MLRLSRNAPWNAVVVIGLALVLMLSFAGCGSEGDGGTDTRTETSTETATADSGIVKAQKRLKVSTTTSLYDTGLWNRLHATVGNPPKGR